MYQVPVQPKINTKITQTPEKINQSYLGKRSHRSVPTAESEPRIVQQERRGEEGDAKIEAEYKKTLASHECQFFWSEGAVPGLALFVALFYVVLLTVM